MNIFYVPPDRIKGEIIELLGQEAKHADQVLRYREGDSITVVDGEGGRYEGVVQKVLKESVQVKLENHIKKKPVNPRRVLGMGIIKKRDRLEFAIEKAVEVGVSEIALFRSEHTVKENVRMDRIESVVLSAMKQSLRAHLPAVKVYDSVGEVVRAYPDHKPLIAHEKNGSKAEANITGKINSDDKYLLLVGPEGGFADEEISNLTEAGGELIYLGDYRLRTETAVVVLLSRFDLYSPGD